MNRHHANELVAVGLTVIGVVAAMVVPFRHEAASVRRNLPPGAQVMWQGMERVRNFAEAWQAFGDPDS